MRTTPAREADSAKQFSVFTANRLGRLHDLTRLLGSNGVNVVALTVLDTTESSIIRIVVDDPDKARSLLSDRAFPFVENDIVVVEIDSATDVNSLMSALLEAEVNIHYLYAFIPHPQGKSLLALSMEDNDMAEKVLSQHQFRILKQADISR
jgi:hypothetical protein